MRKDNFLRTPIKKEHQNLLQDLDVSEQPLEGNPSFQNIIYPQSLNISFNAISSDSELQIAPLWEGVLYFLSDDKSSYPSDYLQVTETNFIAWKLEGDVILHTSGISFISLEEAFNRNVSLINPVPSSVVYSKVVITKEFLFTTLRNMNRMDFIFNGVKVDKNDQDYHKKLVFSFLQGKTGIWCPISSDDPSDDFATNPLPKIKLADNGKSTLSITISSHVAESLDFNWFKHEPEYDEIEGQYLVPPSINNAFNQYFNPAHPSHSGISALALFKSASDISYTVDHDPTIPLRVAFSSNLLGNKVYRRIEIIRPHIPSATIGVTTTSNPQRPYPLYQIAWQKNSGGSIESLRLPLNGRLYLPLENENYKFWVIPRSLDPSTITEGNNVRLSEKVSTKKYIGIPQLSININITANDSVRRIYAHLLDYDSKRIWKSLMNLGDGYIRLKANAEQHWNVDVMNWFINRSSSMAEYAKIYGYINESAGRHELAPEFLHAVFMGEGVGAPEGLIENNRIANPPIHFSEDQIINGWIYLGLDDIQNTLPTLIAENYLDNAFNNTLTNLREETNEVGETKNTADIVGWNAAIELIAAELHSRLDEMLSYCSLQNIDVSTELQNRFLAYIRYNTSANTSQNLARSLNANLRKWTGSRPYDGMNGRYNTLQRIAIAEWYEKSSVYR